jgi:hypothetical protein
LGSSFANILQEMEEKVSAPWMICEKEPTIKIATNKERMLVYAIFENGRFTQTAGDVWNATGDCIGDSSEELTVTPLILEIQIASYKRDLEALS